MLTPERKEEIKEYAAMCEKTGFRYHDAAKDVNELLTALEEEKKRAEMWEKKHTVAFVKMSVLEDEKGMTNALVEAKLLSTIRALEEAQHQLHDQDEALIAANGLIDDLQNQLLQAQQTIARQQEAMDRASDMMNHKHPAYRLLQDAILPAGEDDQP